MKELLVLLIFFLYPVEFVSFHFLLFKFIQYRINSWEDPNHNSIRAWKEVTEKHFKVFALFGISLFLIAMILLFW